MRRLPLALLLAAAAGVACSEPRAEVAREASAAPICAGVPEPDVSAIQRRLVAGAFEELERELRAYQAALEQSQACEPRAWKAFGAFLDARRGVERAEFAIRLDEWVAAQPTAFVPKAARGTFYLGEGFRATGSRPLHVSKVTDEMRRARRAALDRAVADLEEVRNLYPRYVFAHTSLMQIYRGRGVLAATTAIAEEAMRLAPASYKVRRIAMESLGPAFGGSYETLEAIARDALKHVDAEPRMRDLPQYTFRARAHDAYRRRDYQDALRWIEEALRYNRSVAILEARLLYLYFAKEYERVFHEAGEVLAMDTRSDVAYQYRGLAYWGVGNHTAALRDLSRSLELDPDDAWILAQRGTLLGRLEKPAEAEADLRRAVELDPRDDLGWRELGRVLVFLNPSKIDEGLECLVRAARLDPVDPENWGALGGALYVKGDAPAARAAYERFLAVAPPDHPGVERVQKYLDGRWETEGHPLRAESPRDGRSQARR